jgi:hypothetical protein
MARSVLSAGAPSACIDWISLLMKRTALFGNLGMILLGSASLLGCAAGGEAEEECLPGDIDCAPDDLDGKADEWNGVNNPERMSQRLTYRIAELPKTGRRTEPAWKDEYPDAVGVADVAWADTYWPTYEGSHNARYQGRTIKSPMEKYDAAFHNNQGCATQPDRIDGPNAKQAWDQYYACAGPAAKWQQSRYQNGIRLHNGIDDDGDGKIDVQGETGVDGIETWWGTCHAWAPAAMVVPEPQHDVEINGVVFQPGDIKALIQNVYDQTGAIMVGGRCNAKEITHDPTKSANDPCSDLNPGALHVVMTNFLGIANLPLVEDRTANFEIWNQPVMGYDITQQNLVDASAANHCVGATGDTWTYNTKAVELYDVRMTVQYLTESGATARPVGTRGFLRSDRYHYILEVNGDGKIIGGRYCTDSENDHVDFLWAPTGRFNPSNPHISVSKVKELIAKSVSRPGGGGGGEAVVFTATPNLAIPDNNPAGVSVDLAVEGVTGARALAVTVDIEHTWRGDLVVELLREGTLVKRLHDRTGGSADNLQQTFTLTAAEVGTANGRWTLRVADTARLDVGTLKSVELSFQ